ncbi:MAG: PilC/PilY family type IV pilus protein [bacterium]|nr:PilC/PilY family type IV pilus protein [bacterium]
MASIHLRTLRRAASVTTLALLCLPLAVNAGDEDIFSAQVPPNVLLMVDNSGSMNAVMEHPSFDSTTFAYSCDIMPDTGNFSTTDYDQDGRATRLVCRSSGCRFEVRSTDSGWTATADTSDDPQNGYIERRYCGQTRRLYTDGLNEDYGNRTWYYSEYAEWLYSLDASDNTTLIGPVGEERTAPQILADIDVSNNGTNYITGDTFAKFQVTRITAARDIARDVIYQTNSDCPAFLGDCGTYEDRVRFGIAQFHRNSHGGFVRAEIDAYSTNRTLLENAITSLDAQTGTPLGETLFKLYTYFMPRDPAAQPTGNNSSQFPGYQYNLTNGDYTSTTSSRPDDPVTESCQKNFIIMITDGEPTSDNFSTSGSHTQGFSSFTGLIGDYAPDAVGDPDIGTDSTPEVGSPPWGSSAGSGYLDDIARWMQLNDCRPDHDGLQNVDVYTVGFGTLGPVNSLLEKTANEGNGLFFAGNQAETLTQALVSSVQDIISKSQGFSAATVPAARTSDGGQLYTTLFQPTSVRPFWPGKLRSYTITAAGEILDANGACALTNLTDPPNCTGGTFADEDTAPPHWNASKMMPGANGRNLTVSLSGSAATFDHTVTAADLGGSGVLGNYTDYPPATGVTSDADLDEAVVAFAAGCEWGTGLSASGGDDFGGCVDRTRVESGTTQADRLGDIFHSNPVVIGAPNSFIAEPSYYTFSNDVTNARRTRVIVAGANDGFLHGFHAGTWRSATGKHDEGTGEEVFGFMPWGARAKIADLAKDDATLHPLSVDGSPAAADVWIDNDSDPTNVKEASEWKTILVSGMREGGEHYFALDMTDPSSSSYPGYMWEFPLESDATWRARVGQTWSQPIITRVRLENGSGEIEETWVAIVGFGYDATSDPNDAAQYNPLSLKGRGIAMIDVETGDPVAVRKFGTATGDVSDMLYAIPSTPGVLDYDQDGFADLIYVGDLGGNIWKWVVRPAGTASPSAAQLYQANWSFRKMFDDDPTRTAWGVHHRSFFFPPAATVVNGILHLGLGSGERTNLNCSSTRDGCVLLNRYYVIKDRDVWDGSSPSMLDGRAEPDGNFTDVTLAEASCPAVEPEGYYFDVVDGEKFVTNSEVFNGFFFSSTFTPDLSNACEPEGLSTLYGLLAKCGQGFFGPPSPTSPIAGIDRTESLGQGMPTDARLSIAPGDGGNRLIISKQDGELINLEAGASDSEHGTMYWRELD